LHVALGSYIIIFLDGLILKSGKMQPDFYSVFKVGSCSLLSDLYINSSPCQSQRHYSYLCLLVVEN